MFGLHRMRASNYSPRTLRSLNTPFPPSCVKYPVTTGECSLEGTNDASRTLLQCRAPGAVLLGVAKRMARGTMSRKRQPERSRRDERVRRTDVVAVAERRVWAGRTRNGRGRYK